MADTSKFVELLTAIQSAEKNVRQQAETLYSAAKVNEPDNLLVGVVSVITSSTVQEATRRQAAVLLRQLVSKGDDKDFVFARASPQTKSGVASELIRHFEQEPMPKLQQQVGEAIVRLAAAAYDKDDQRGWIVPGQQGWPALLPMVFRLANTATNNNEASCESAIGLLVNLVQTLKSEVVKARTEIGVILQNGFQSTIKVQVKSFLLVCEMVEILDKSDWAPLIGTANTLTNVMMQLVTAKQETELEQCLQEMVEVANAEPDFFKVLLTQQLEPAKTMAVIAKNKDLENGIRNLALEWLTTYVEKRPKFLSKTTPQFISLALECSMAFLLEVEDGEEDLKEWASRMDDEEGEEDADVLFHTGEETIDRIVEGMTIEPLAQPLFELIATFARQESWQAKHAALSAVKQTVEYVEEHNHVDEMAKLLIAHVDHPHPRVRYAALHAIGQLGNDQAPYFQDTYHRQIMPLLLRKMSDQVDRVASMAMSAFVSYGEELDKTLMLTYSQEFMQHLVQRLQSTSHRMVQEEAITSIAVIAGVIEKDFALYYDGMMPLLKQFIMQATGEKQRRLRGKSFECMSLLGIAVGKEKFLPDAREAVGQMLNTQLDDEEDIQREYIKEASERICKCLKEDFAPFLSSLLPGIFKSMKVEGIAAEIDTGNDTDYISLDTGKGNMIKVKTSKFEECVQAVQLLHTFAEDMGAAFFPFIHPSAEALLPLLTDADPMAACNEEARSVAMQAWGLMIKSAKAAATAKGEPATLAQQLLATFLQKVIPNMQSDPDCETVGDGADGIGACLKAAGPGSIAGNDVQTLVQQLFCFIDASFTRTMEAEKDKKSAIAGAPQELQQGEDEDEDEEEDEVSCRNRLEDAIGAVMEVAQQDFLPCLTECGNRIQQWLASQDNRALALFLAADMLKHLKDASKPAWPIFMPAVISCLTDKDPDVRTPASYCINLAAPLPDFAEAAPKCFQILAQVVSAPAPKKKDEKAKVALDNAVSALVALAKSASSVCPGDIKPWALIVSKLPLKADDEEAKKVHEIVVNLVLEQHAGLLEGDNLGKTLSVLAEVHKQEDISSKETDDKIKKVFQMIPADTLRNFQACFTEKQAKKIEKMLSE